MLANSDNYGIGVANIGDLNGDGVTDIAVGAWADDTGGAGRGAVHISFLNTDGSVDSTVKIDDSTTNGPVIAANSDGYGWSVEGMGDLDGDAINDIVVGAYFDDTGGADRGAVFISFLNTDASVKSTVKIDDTTTNGPVLTNVDYYGIGVANMGDLDGDGITDLVVSAQSDDAGGTDRGAVHIHYLKDLTYTVSGNVYEDEGVTGVPNGTVVKLLINGVVQQTTTTLGVTGAYTFTDSYVAGDIITVFIDDDATYDGATITKVLAANVT